jgi:hypothetical protein
MVRKKAMSEDEFAEWFHSVLNVSETGCWEWTLGKSQDGYGKVKRLSRTMPAHRWALEHALGRPLGEGMVTRHTCNNRPCCNPAHLLEGTPNDNVNDRVRDGRSVGPRGERQWNSKLTREQVAAIKLYAGPMNCQELATTYGVSRTCISRIRDGTRWNHINPQ